MKADVKKQYTARKVEKTINKLADIILNKFKLLQTRP